MEAVQDEAAPPAAGSELSEEGLKRKDLILRNLQEVLGEDKLIKQISAGKNIHIYWGTATTGRPHVGYFVPMQKIADFLRAGIRVSILFADLHGFLDNLKSSWNLLENRVLYYEQVIKALLTALDVPIDKLHFAKGSSYQLTEAYTQDILRLCSLVSVRDALKAGAEVVKQVDDPYLSGLLYPLLQALDEQYLKVDGQFGGVDQRKIFILAEMQLPKLKLGKRFHLMNPMIPGLTGSKMSSSEENTKIDLLDSSEVVCRKINSAACPKKSSGQENGILAFFKFVVLPILQDELPREEDGHTTSTTSLRLDKLQFHSFQEIEDAFENELLSEAALKSFLSDFLNQILAKVQKRCDNEEMREIISRAYPTLISADNSSSSNLAEMGAMKLCDKESEIKQSETFRTIMRTDLPSHNVGPVTRRVAENKPVRVLWRCSIKGHVTLAHITALYELKRLQLAGCECSILLSDLGAFLDNEKCSWAALEGRTNYYEAVLRECMSQIDLKNVKIRRSRENEFEERFTLDMYKMVSKTTKDESALVDGHSLGGHLCVVYFALDLHYSEVDLVLMDARQRTFYDLSQKICTQLGMALPSALELPTVLGMDGKRMSATDSEHHLEPFDTPKQLKQKIGKSFCEPGNLEGPNVALNLCSAVIFPCLLESGNGFLIERTAEYGGNLEVKTYKALEELFAKQELHPGDLKQALFTKLNNDLLEPVRKSLAARSKQLLQSAFPVSKGGGKKK